MATKTKARKGAIEKVVESAVDAAEEIGEAATSFKQSWDHVRRARAKAAPATRAVARTSKKALSTAKKVTGLGRTKRRRATKQKVRSRTTARAKTRSRARR